MFRALGYQGPIEFDGGHGGRTRFVVRDTEDGEVGLIVVGPDVFPGFDVANANAVMDPLAAVAHEITHYERWRSGRELPMGHLEDIDEAMTSLQAACAFHRDLNSLHIEQLVSDALERLARFVRNNPPHEQDEEHHG